MLQGRRHGTARGGVPDPGRSVPTARDDAPAVGAEGYTVYRSPVLQGAPKRTTGCYAPEPCGFIVTGRQHRGPVRAERRRPHNIAVPPRGRDQLAAGHVPELGRSVPAA